MIDFNTAEKKLELIYMKYELSNYPIEFIMNNNNTEELYYDLLFRLETIMVLDKDFTLLGNHMDKYREIINLGRNKYRTKGEIRDYENLTLTALNSLEQTKEEYREKYLMEQLQLRFQLSRRKRDWVFLRNDIQDIDKAICELSEFDYVYLNVMNQLKNGVVVKTTEDPKVYLSSICYLLKNAKEIFLQDRGYFDTTLSIIDTFDENNLIPKDYSIRKIKRQLNTINKKR